MTLPQNDNNPREGVPRQPAQTDTDINKILVNGASIAVSKLRRAKTFDARLYHYAEISVYLEVSLSEGAGITDETREQLEKLHMEATHLHMQKSKNFKLEK